MKLIEETPYRFRIEEQGAMRVPGIVFASRALLSDEHADMALAQVANVASCRGSSGPSLACPTCRRQNSQDRPIQPPLNAVSAWASTGPARRRTALGLRLRSDHRDALDLRLPGGQTLARTSSTVAVAGRLTVLDTAASTWRCTAACMRRCPLRRGPQYAAAVGERRVNPCFDRLARDRASTATS